MDQPARNSSPRRSSRVTSAQKINYKETKTIENRNKEKRDYSGTRRSEPKINTKAFSEAQDNPGKSFVIFYF